MSTWAGLGGGFEVGISQAGGSAVNGCWTGRNGVAVWVLCKPSRRLGGAVREFKPFSGCREAEKGTRKPAGKNSKVIWKGAMLVMSRPTKFGTVFELDL